jgi:penicillin G amidase
MGFEARKDCSDTITRHPKDRFMRTLLIVLAAAAAACGAEVPATEGQAKPLTFEAIAKASLATLEGTLRVPGLQAGVEVLRDRWGVPHIYAANVDDLFFAQGYTIAQDRLWHMEMTRRVAQGRVAEIVGKAALPHDRLVRLLRFRGPFDEKEWTSYHPEARRIFEAYTRGINAFIAQNAANLPVEFKLTGVTPEPWKADEILYRARVNAAVASARSELRLAQSVARLGAGEANRRARPEPYGELDVAPGLDFNIITDDVLKALDGNLSGDFPRPDLLEQYRSWPGASFTAADGAPERSPGSNNWAVSAPLTATGKPIMVDDPHRQVTLPAWRYLVHLHAPGWNVIGATEPGLPGVIRGHNGAGCLGTHRDRHGRSRCLRRGAQPRERRRGEVAGSVGAAAGRHRVDRREGSACRGDQARVQPARTNLLQGHDASPRLCAALVADGAGHGGIHRRPANGPGRERARLSRQR